MSLIFIDSFDQTSSMVQKYEGASGASVITGRRGGNAVTLGSSGYVSKTLSVLSNPIIVGSAINIGTSITPGASTELYFYYKTGSSTQHVRIKFYSPAANYFYMQALNAAGTVLGTTSNFYSGIWYYFEVKVNVDSSTGSITIKMDEVETLNLTNINTRNGSTTASVNEIQLYTSNPGQAPKFDDLYVADTLGSVNNDFLGDIRIDLIVPNGAGNYTQWTPSTGSNYTCVDEQPNTGTNTDYVSETTLNEMDTYTYSDVSGIIPTLTNILGVQHNILAKRGDTGVPTKIKPVARVSSTDYLGTEVTLTDGFFTQTPIWNVNPATGQKWTRAEIDAAEFGVVLSATS